LNTAPEVYLLSPDSAADVAQETPAAPPRG
jgi:hypothetical protein